MSVSQPRLGLTDAEVKAAIEGMSKEEAQEFMDRMTDMTLRLASELDDLKEQERTIVSLPPLPLSLLDSVLKSLFFFFSSSQPDPLFPSFFFFFFDLCPLSLT